MKELYVSHLASKNELTAVTGLIAGGTTGRLTNRDGSVKYIGLFLIMNYIPNNQLHMYILFLKCTKYQLMNF